MKHKVFQILVFICTLAAFTAGQAQAADERAAIQQEESARQLRIYRDSLLQGSTEEIRVDAAVGLLLRDDEASRNALVSALKSSENLSARQAVCKALIKSRGLEQAIGSRAIYLEPLMAILSTDTTEGAVLAAEALLLYGYEDIEMSLEAILNDADKPRQIRLNAVYVLQIRSEKQSLARLVGLLDDADTEISKAAETALQEAFGIPVGASRKVWDDILEKLKRKSPDDIRRELLLLKETKLRQVQAERDRWQKLYLGALDKQYEGLAEEGRAKMTLEVLNDDLAAVRVWALEKVAQYPMADNESLRDMLLALLEDESRDVRLETAKVLNSMSALDPAEQLLKQFKQEDDLEVRLAMFEALGEACFFAFSPGSEVKLSADIKAETLSIAAEYLASEQTDAAKKGAEVIRKILELNNLPKDSINYYLVLISNRYEQAAPQNPAMRADLLSVMSHLCGQGVPKAQASKLYKKYFVEAVAVKDDSALRLAAIKGMVSVDPVEAMRLAKENRLLYDDDLAIRQVVIDLAGQAGGADELGPLLEVMNANGQKDLAWQAIKRICQRQKSGFLLRWATELGKNSGRDESVREILDLAEQKALGEKNAENVKLARQRLIGWYRQQQAWEQGVAYLDEIQFSPAEHSYSEPVLVSIFEIYLHSKTPEKVSQVIENKLLKADFDESSSYLTSLSTFLENPGISDAAKRRVFEKLLTVSVARRPVWEKFKSNLSNLYQILLSSEVPDKPNSTEPLLPENRADNVEN